MPGLTPSSACAAKKKKPPASPDPQARNGGDQRMASVIASETWEAAWWSWSAERWA